MKDIIKKLLREAIINLPDTTHKQELRYASYPSLSDPKKRADLNDIRARIARASSIASSSDKEYFNSPQEGDGFYQVEFRHDGKITTKHIMPSADMLQQGGKFQPSDVGTCKDFQNTARYCFVKAGKENKSIGKSPAEDAANKALIIFADQILSFYGDSYIDPEKSAQISKEKMSQQMAKHKDTKDAFDNRERKSTISMDPTQAADIEAKQAAAKARLEKAMARLKKS